MTAAMMDLGMNERAWTLADRCVSRAAELRVAVHTLPGGARVVDAGVAVPGGFAAGLALAELCLGGLGHVAYASLTIGGDAWPGVHVWTDHPAVACMASQYAGWAINPEGYFAMGSGPLRAKASVERELFAKLAYAEHPTRGVLGVGELREEFALDARFGAQRTRSHGEIPLGVDRPSRVLRGHAGYCRVVGPHVDARPRVAADGQRGVRNVPETAQAQLRQRQARGEASRHGDAGVHDARATGERVHGNAELRRARDAPIGQRPRALVHAQVHH